MKSRLYVGRVLHERFEPVAHRFVYPVFVLALDLDELPEVARTVRGFGHNRTSLLSIHDRHYLRGAGSIRERLLRFLAERGCADGIARVELVTFPRCLNRAFVPVSFYYCYRADGGLRCAAAEVNNTFGERHLYILERPIGAPGAWPAVYRQDKEFFVSPFNDMRGHYELSFGRLAEDLRISVTLYRDGRRILVAALAGAARPLTSRALAAAVARQPLGAALNLPRILLQAADLYARKRLRIHRKPNPSSPLTIGVAPPGPLERLGRRVVFALLGRLVRGDLTLTLPDGATRSFGLPGTGRSLRIALHNHAFFARVLVSGDVGFGEAYAAGDWDCDDLTGLIRLLIDNADALDGGNVKHAWLGRLLTRARHGINRNTQVGSRRNIQAHYDLGNDFFAAFLDRETMAYSCALFAQPDQSLAEAQQNKLRTVIRRADIRAGDHVLEIGCGWGGFAIAAARATGCRVTGITLSVNQAQLTRERVRQAGLSDRIDIRIVDYRELDGRYDKIVSIEMLEAVGHRYYGAFFAACDRLLNPGGRVVLQVITIPDQRYDAYRRNPDWIQKHIFPGGMLPSLTALTRAITRHSPFVLEELENIGPHYAPTLKMWRERFTDARAELIRLGYGDELLRKWVYYLCYCEAGFAARALNDLQLVLRRPGAGG
jgi:cyclopropane-fatty-acyl-phospholipid synthase